MTKRKEQTGPDAVRIRRSQRLVRDASGAYVRNVALAIEQYGHDEDFIPTSPCNPTDAAPGSPEKIQVLCERVRLGQPLWHSEDEMVLARVNATIQIITRPCGPRARKEWRSDTL